MTNKLNVLFISHSSALYGAERSLLEIVIGLQNSHIKPLLLVPSKGLLTNALNELDIPYIVSPYMGWLGSKNILIKGMFRLGVNTFASINLLNKLKPFSIDLIYTNTIIPPIGGILAFSLGIPHIWHIRELMHERNAKYDLGENLSMKFINKVTQKVICNSYAVYNNFINKNIINEKLCVVYNGILKTANKNKYLKKQLNINQPIKLCIVGSLCDLKNQLHAILALNILLECGIDAILRITGNGESSYLNKLEEISKQLGIERRVIFDGYIEDTMEVFKSSDISLICSKSETFGRVAVESMSVGTPVVAAKVGGLPEIIENEVNGLLYEAGNYNMLATQIMRLIHHPNLYESISEYGIVSVYDRFTTEKCVSKIEAIIQEVINQ